MVFVVEGEGEEGVALDELGWVWVRFGVRGN
jgi:hypothetical protein